MTEYEKMNGKYHQLSNYYLPNLEIAEQNEVFMTYGDSNSIGT